MLAVRAAMRPLSSGLAFRAPPQARSIHLPPLSRVVGRSGLLSKFSTALHRVIFRAAQHVSGKVPRLPRPFRLSPRSSIGTSLSLPARFALARPFGGTPFMPRPLMVRAPLHQVGLGTARTFATTRPVFANIVENVPVVARSLIQADFDLKSSPSYRLRSLRANRATKSSRPQAKAKARSHKLARPESEKLDVEALALYFRAAPAATVVTYLDIPLAPTPSGSMPLAEHPLPGPPMAPLQALAQTQATHRKHAIRVASLFHRLDAASVWDKGAAMEAFGDSSGLCTVLRVTFNGWDEQMVRNVIGEGGKGWCALLEARPVVDNPWTTDTEMVDEDHLSSRSISPSPWRDNFSPFNSIDFAAATDSFIMPSMDFSASCTSMTSVASSTMLSGIVTPFTRLSDHDEPFSSYASSEMDHADAESLSEGSDNISNVWSAETDGTTRLSISFSSDHWRHVSTVIGDF